MAEDLFRSLGDGYGNRSEPCLAAPPPTVRGLS